MIQWLIEVFMEMIFGFAKRKAADCFRRKVEAEALKVYLKSLLAARGLLIAVVSVLFFAQLTVFGFMSFLAAAIWWSPFSEEIKIALVLGVSFFLFFIPFVLVIYLLSERFWFRISGAKDFFERLTADSNRPQ